jgi:cytochrome c5
MTRSAWAVVAAAAIGIAACGSDNGNNDNGGSTKPAACTPPVTASVKFSTDVHPILVASCGTCHNDASTTLPKFGSATVATSYAAVQPFVNTTNPAASVLLVKGNGGSSHGGGDRLSDTDTATIQKWITECAQNN